MCCTPFLRLLHVCAILFVAFQSATQAASLKNSDITGGRIVGGMETSIQYFPHMASLQANGTHLCGAAIISQLFVVTAGHCVHAPMQPHMYQVRVGSAEHDRFGELHAVRRFLVHELFNTPTGMNNDIALVQLQSTLSYGQFVQPIPLVTLYDNITPHAVLFVSGWGATTSESQQSVKRLRYTLVSLSDQQACKLAYASMGTVTQTMFCAGSVQGGRDSCQGDSGGPLVTFVGGLVKLYGLVSWGTSCAEPQYPGVYTNMQYYAQWVQATMEWASVF